AIPACAVAFTPLLFALTFGEPAMRQVARVTRAVPRWAVPALAEIVLDWVSQEPGPSGAVLQGILFGRTAPERTVRETLTPPALVLGPPRAPVPPFAAAAMLAHEPPTARLIDATSLLELRLRPERLTARIAEFIGECWREEPAAATGRRAASA